MVTRLAVPERGEGRDEAERVDRRFQALADATRRDILRLVLASEQSVSALAAHYPMSFAAVHKHVAVLERAELVHKRRQGREQLVRGDIDAFGTVNRVLDQYAAIWRSRIAHMDEILAEDAAVETDLDAAACGVSRKRTNEEEQR